MVEVLNWTCAAVSFISKATLKSCLPCFQRNPSLCSGTDDNSGGQRSNPSCPDAVYSHYISGRWETIISIKRINFGTGYFYVLWFQSEPKWQNCPIFVLFIKQVRYGCIYQPTHTRSSCARHYKTKSCSESWTSQKISLYLWNVWLGGVPNCVTLLVPTFLQ